MVTWKAIQPGNGASGKKGPLTAAARLQAVAFAELSLRRRVAGREPPTGRPRCVRVHEGGCALTLGVSNRRLPHRGAVQGPELTEPGKEKTTGQAGRLGHVSCVTCLTAGSERTRDAHTLQLGQQKACGTIVAAYR